MFNNSDMPFGNQIRVMHTGGSDSYILSNMNECTDPLSSTDVGGSFDGTNHYHGLCFCSDMLTPETSHYISF